MANRWGNNGNSGRLYFLGLQNPYRWWCSHEIKRCLLFGRKAMTNLDSIIKKQRHYLANKSPYSQSYGFSSSHLWIWEWDHKEGWVPKNWCIWTAVLEKTGKSLLDCKEANPVNPKGNPYWIFIGRTDTEAAVFWPPDAKSWLIWKDPDAGKDWMWKDKGTIENEVVGWHTNSMDMSLSNWTSSRRWWWPGKPGVLQSMELQRVRHNWATELNWTDPLLWIINTFYSKN